MWDDESDDLQLDGVPFTQLSESEGVMLALKLMARRLPPADDPQALRLICIDRLEALDATNRQLVAAFADNHGIKIVGARVTDADVEPITVTQAKAHLRVTHDMADTQIGELITRVRHFCEEVLTHRSIADGTVWRQTFDRFPAGSCIELRMPPLQSVTDVRYYDTDGVETVLDTDVYEVLTDSAPGMVVLKPGQSWPTTQANKFGAVWVNYVAGYGHDSSPAEAVPGGILDGMYLILGTRWELPMDVAMGTIIAAAPQQAHDLLRPYKIRTL